MFTKEQLASLDNTKISAVFNRRHKYYRARAFWSVNATGVSFHFPKSLGFMGMTVRYFKELQAFRVVSLNPAEHVHLWPSNIERVMFEIGAVFAHILKADWPEKRSGVAFVVQRDKAKLYTMFAPPFLGVAGLPDAPETEKADPDDLL